LRLRLALLFLAVAAAAAAAGIYLSLGASKPGVGGTPFARASAPKPMPELRFEDGAGRARTLADFRGKLVLLNVWATWCAPCREEMPALDRLQAELGGPSFEVVALSVDQQGPEVARRFLGEIGVKSLALYIDRSASAAFKLDTPGLPVSLLLDRQGREIGRHLGPAKWDAPEVLQSLRSKLKP
jgi:thiol-disulfide isomerase/thioredoxin